MFFCLLFAVFVFSENLSPKKQIDIVMSTDERYFRPTIVTMTSLFENAGPNTLYHVRVLIPGDFKLKNKLRIDSLKEKFKNCAIDFTNMSNKYRFLTWPAPSYYRLEIASLFPDLKKCIYLDSDLIVRHDLSEMWETNMHGFYVAGVCQGAPKHPSYLGIPNVIHYICAGVMIINMESIRQNNLEENISKLVAEKGKVFMYADQDIINVACFGKTLCLPDEYGLMINLKHFRTRRIWETERNPTIVHFVGVKPWQPMQNPKKVTTYHREFWEYAKKANLYNDLKPQDL